MALEKRTPFHPQAALAELERLQAAIQATRRKREQAIAEFQGFLDRSRQPVAARVRADAPVQVVAPVPAVAAPVETARPGDNAPGIAPARRRWLTMAAALGGLIVAAVAGFTIWPTVQAPAPTDHAVPADSWPATSTAPEPPVALPTPAPANPAVPEAPLRITLTTSRVVWLRVMVDGWRRLEREVPAGEELSFAAQRGIVIRAGDAGGVTLTVNGASQGVLGGNYAVVTKAIEAPGSGAP